MELLIELSGRCERTNIWQQCPSHWHTFFGLRTDLADNSLGGVECTAHHPGSRGVADIVSVTMSLLSIKDLAVAISTRAGPAEDDPPLY